MQTKLEVWEHYPQWEEEEEKDSQDSDAKHKGDSEAEGHLEQEQVEQEQSCQEDIFAHDQPVAQSCHTC